MIRLGLLILVVSRLINAAISPVFFGKYYSTGGEFLIVSKELYTMGAGIEFNFESDSLSISGNFMNSRFFGVSKQSATNLNIFNRYESIAYSGGDVEGNKFDYDISNILIKYKYRLLEFVFGKYI